MKLPFCESLSVHENGNLKKIAGWIFERLDTEGLNGGEHSTFYLCYHRSDYDLFSDPESVGKLKEYLWTIYNNEVRWDGKGFGDLKFSMEYDERSGSLSLTPRKKKRGGLWGWLIRTEDAGEEETKFLLNFHWIEDSRITEPGVLGLVRCSKEYLEPGKNVTGTISFDGEVFFSEHLEASQRGARWHERVVYLSETVVEISIGDMPGCDIRTSNVSEPVEVRFDGNGSTWECRSLISEDRVRTSGFDNLDLEFANGRGKTSLRCRKVEGARTLAEFEEENRMPFFSIQIIGCVFPKSVEHIPIDFPGRNLEGVGSVLRLPGNRWLYLMGQNPNPYFLDSGNGAEAKYLDDGNNVTLNGFPPNGKDQKGTWHAGTGADTEDFYRGEFRFSPGLFSYLVTGPSRGDFPAKYFTNYSDVVVGGSPLDLITEDGRKFFLKFKEDALQAVFLTDKDLRVIDSFEPKKQKEIKIGDEADFILGSTHYKLSHSFTE